MHNPDANVTMQHPEIAAEPWRDFIEWHRNWRERHCQIGKVTYKLPGIGKTPKHPHWWECKRAPLWKVEVMLL